MLLTLLSGQTTGAANLLPPLVVNTNTFYAPTVTTGAVTLTPLRYDNPNTFYTATVTGGSGGGAVQDWRLLLRIRRLQLYKRNYRV